MTLKTKSVFGLVAGLAIALSLVIGAGTASALTASDIDTLVALGIISADKAATAKAALTTTSYSTLKVGSTGADVVALQEMLVKGGYLVMPAGVKYGYYGSLTAAAYAKYQAAQVATPVVTTPSTSGSLKGGAGDVIVSDTSTNVEDTMKEGEEDVNVLGFKVEADGSDIELTSAKVTLYNDGTASSERLSDYVDEVKVFKGSTEVGSVDASDFSRDSGSPDTYSKTISLDDAVVAEDDDAKFYVAVTAAGNIDSDDMDSAEWVVELNTLRFTDATGAILSADTDNGLVDGVASTSFTFEDESEDDKITLKTSSTDPDATTFEVSEDDKSDEYLVGAFKLDVDDDSSDITLNDILLTADLGGYDSATTTSIEDVIDTLTVKVGSDEFEADVEDSTLDGSGLATYKVDFEDGEMVIEAGDVVEVKIYAVFNETDEGANYKEGTTLKVSVDKADIDAEGEDDVVLSGTDYDSETHTLKVDAVTTKLTSASWSTSLISDTENDVYTAKFVFTVTAPEDQNIYLPLDTFNFSSTSGIAFTKTGNGTTTDITLSSNADETDEGYLVEADTTETFTFTVDVEGDGTSHKIVITSIAYETEDDADDSATTFDSAITTGLDDFKTTTKTLYR